MRFISLVLIISFLATSCASMFSGTKDTFYIRSEEPNSTFFVNNREIGKGTNAIVTLSKKGLDKKILRVEKQGCTAKISPIETQFDPISLLGILIDFGIITMLLVDWAGTGAITEASQNDFILTPECS